MFRNLVNECVSAILKVKYSLKAPGGGKIRYGLSNKLYLDKTSMLEVHGELVFDGNTQGIWSRRNIIELRKGAKLVANYSQGINYGADIRVFENAELVIGKGSYINNNCLIRCKMKIQIGDDCAIANTVTIFD